MHHLPAIVIARPKEVQALEKAPKLRDAGVCGMGKGAGCSSAWSHQSKSFIVLHVVFKSPVLESQKDWQLNQTATNLDWTAVAVLGGP